MIAELREKPGTDELLGIYRSALPSVARMVKNYGGTLDDAKDVFHDALLTWLEKDQTFRDGIADCNAYLVTIARNEWFRRIEKIEKQNRLDIPLRESETIVSEELYRYVVSTGKKCLALLQAFYYENLKAGAIADRFGFSNAHSVSVQKYKCLEKLKHLVKTNNRKKEDFYES